MRYLVTGAGLIGGAIAARLAESHDVRVLDLEPHDLPSGVEQVVGNLADLEVVRAAVDGVDGIFHTAALHGIHLGSHTAEDFIRTNVVGTFNVFEAASAAGVTRVVHSSTTGVFGRGAGPSPDGYPTELTEATPLQPTDNYGNSKVLCEELCHFYARARGTAIVALRYGAVRQLVERLTEFTVAHALSGGITDVDDAVSANLQAMDRVGSLPRAVYSVLPTTLFDAATYRAAADPRRALLQMLPWLPEDRLPAELPRPAHFHDAAYVESELGFRIRGDQPAFLRAALNLAG